MPPKPLFHSESLRSSVIAAVMLTVLVASMAMSYVLVEQRRARWTLPTLSPMSVGDMQISVPQGWQPVKPPPTAKHLRSPVLFRDPKQPDRQVLVAVLPGEARNPIAAFNTAWHGTLSGQPLQQIASPFQNDDGSIVGLQEYVISAADRRISHHVLAVCTHDGRRYWCVHLSEPTVSNTPPSPRAHQYLVRLANAICFSVPSHEPEPVPHTTDSNES